MTGPSVHSITLPAWSFALPLLAMSLLAGAAYGAHEPEEPPMAEAAPAPAPSVPEYRSPLESFKSYAEAEMVPWQAANDRVGEIGGWRVYAREAFDAPESSESDENSGEIQ